MKSNTHTLEQQQLDGLQTCDARKTPIGWAIRIVFTGWLGLYVLAAMGCATETSPMWKKLDGAPYPVQVNSLITSNRGVLSSQRTLTYGDWRVGFSKETPVATSENNCSWQFRCDVKIDPLICTTSNGRVSDCSLRFDTMAEHCDLLIADTRATIKIACPVDIILAARDKQTLTRLSAETSSRR